VLRSNPPEELHAAVRDAVRSCPTQSILIDEEIG
jgi:ferredoxin